MDPKHHLIKNVIGEGGVVPISNSQSDIHRTFHRIVSVRGARERGRSNHCWSAICSQHHGGCDPTFSSLIAPMPSKLKTLVFGPIGDEIDAFVLKLETLHKSKAGPFDVAFVLGSVALDQLKDRALPLPIYLQGDKPGDCEKLSENLYALPSPGIVSLEIDKDPLIVVSCPSHFRVDSKDSKALLDNLQHVSYTGCDILLSHEWPQGIASVIATQGNESFDVADVALKARARYHFCPGATFIQSPPFAHLAATTNTVQCLHVGRFLSLAGVQAKPPSKEHKFVHALALQPLHSLSRAELATQKAVIPCPFTDAVYEGGNAGAASVGLSDASARRILAEEAGPYNRWGQKRTLDETDSKTLFVHGFRDRSDAGEARLLQALGPDVLRIRRRDKYIFADFATHEAAAACLEAPVIVDGVALTVRWASTKNEKRQRLTEDDAKDSSTLHFRVTQREPGIIEVGEIVRKHMEETLENALAGGDDGERVTASTEPALQVSMRIPEADKNYGFLSFASHAAASMALATLTGSTDGGRVQTVPESVTGNVFLNWAQEKDAAGDKDIIEDGSGFMFERKHFPADSRTDCWFCLASESCERHLITGVYDKFYTAMPKGPVHQGHVLLIPVQHNDSGAFTNPVMAEEASSLIERMRRHTNDVFSMDLYVFERAMQTKGGYHTHVQCVPVPRNVTAKLQMAMTNQARKIGIDMRELSADLPLSTVLSRDDAGYGYFYAELPSADGGMRRYMYMSDGRTAVPLQFGREVVAAALGKPELAHWKSSVVSREKEAELASSLRESLSKYL